MALISVICVAGVVGGSIWLMTGHNARDQQAPPRRPYTESIKRPPDIFEFARFIVLLPHDDNNACLLLSISVKVSNPKVYDEMSQKRARCRGAVYRVLDLAARAGYGQVAIDDSRVRQQILDSLNGVLATGTVDAVIVKDFSAV
ncbi:MAG: hypothetical protein J7J91_09295 [Deltaproteobacteria bacterium]|nr:hypothetical protein [Deltaproteobacteria bacterium]